MTRFVVTAALIAAGLTVVDARAPFWQLLVGACLFGLATAIPLHERRGP